MRLNSGRENDGNGLYYYRARFYNNQTGRFISEDPIGFAGLDTNFYRYVFNSPIGYNDPVGMWAFGGTAGASIEGGGEIATYNGSFSLQGGATFSGSRGVLWGPDGPSDVDFYSYGAFGRAFINGSSRGPCPGPNSFAAGAYAGIGVGAFFSNARKPSDIEGPFDTFSVNTPFGSGQLGVSNEIFVLSVTAGPGSWFSVSRYTTITAPVITTVHR
jgi:RHS repeat-associated protein